MTLTSRAVLASIAGACLASAASAQTRNLVSNGWGFQTVGEWAAPFGDTNLGKLPNIFLGDHFYKNSWYYRTGSTAFPNINGVWMLGAIQNATFTQIAPNIGRWYWPSNGPGGTPFFACELIVRFDHMGGVDDQYYYLSQQLKITNVGTSTLVLNLFNLVDPTCGATDGDDTLFLTDPFNVSRWTMTDPFNGSLDINGIGATRYQMGTGTAMRQLYNIPTGTFAAGSVVQLTNSGSPVLAQDAAGNFQWTLTIPRGTSQTVRSIIGYNTPAVQLPAISCARDYNQDNFVNLDDVADFITDYYTDPPIPGGLQPNAPSYPDIVIGAGMPCPFAGDAPAPYAASAYRTNGYRVGYSLDGTNACPAFVGQPFPNLDNLTDFISAYYDNAGAC